MERSPVANVPAKYFMLLQPGCSVLANTIFVRTSDIKNAYFGRTYCSELGQTASIFAVVSSAP